MENILFINTIKSKSHIYIFSQRDISGLTEMNGFTFNAGYKGFHGFIFSWNARFLDIFINSFGYKIAIIFVYLQKYFGE